MVATAGQLPPVIYRGQVEPEWIDYNGHMNLAYYVLVFDLGTDELLEHLGLGEAYLKQTACTTFVLETHVTYERELKLGDPFELRLQLLDHDEKRIHYFQYLYHAEAGYLAATTELMKMHIDTTRVSGTPMPDEARLRLCAMSEAQASLPSPPQLGRVIGIRRKQV